MAVPSKRAGQNGGREAKVKMQEGISPIPPGDDSATPDVRKAPPKTVEDRPGTTLGTG